MIQFSKKFIFFLEFITNLIIISEIFYRFFSKSFLICLENNFQIVLFGNIFRNYSILRQSLIPCKSQLFPIICEFPLSLKIC